MSTLPALADKPRRRRRTKAKTEQLRSQMVDVLKRDHPQSERVLLVDLARQLEAEA